MKFFALLLLCGIACAQTQVIPLPVTPAPIAPPAVQPPLVQPAAVTSPPLTLTATSTTCTVTGGAQMVSIAVPTIPVTPPVIPPVTPSGVVWVYHNGAMLWGGDWSFAGSVNYKDTSGVPIDGGYDIEFSSTGYGGWQPYVISGCQSNTALCFNTAGYNYIIFSAKATQSNQVFKMGLESSGDTPDTTAIYDIGPYCSGGDNPSVGVWETCKVPFTVFKMNNPLILKFSIGSQFSGASAFYLDDVGISP